MNTYEILILIFIIVFALKDFRKENELQTQIKLCKHLYGNDTNQLVELYKKSFDKIN